MAVLFVSAARKREQREGNGESEQIAEKHVAPPTFCPHWHSKFNAATSVVNICAHSRTKPESPFGLKNGTDHTPIPLFADSVKQFSYGPPSSSSEIRSSIAPNRRRFRCPSASN